MVSVKKAGRKPRGAANRIEVRRHGASTTLRVKDRHIALLHKLAAKRELPLSEALELALDTACTELGVKVRASKTAELGWQ